MGYTPSLPGSIATNTYDATMYMGVVTIGAAGAVSSQVCKPAVVAYASSAGKYTITLPCNYKTLVNADFTLYSPSGTLLSGCVTDESTLSTTGVITVEFRNGGTATDLTNGWKFYFQLVVSTSQLNASV